METIDPVKFVAAVTPLLERKDPTALFLLLKSNWPPEQIRQLLRGPASDAKKMAIVSLGLIGPTCCVDDLARQLHDPDPVVCDMAEHALWSVWFRGGATPQANQLVCRGSMAMNSRDYQTSIELLSAAVQIDPNFPEAYNQRAIAYYLTERYEQSIGDCKRTIKRMACHFGAWCGKGHCHAHLGEKSLAIECYQQALAIHPRLHCIRESLHELERRYGN